MFIFIYGDNDCKLTKARKEEATEMYEVVSEN